MRSCAYRKLDPTILMMKAAKDRLSNKLAEPVDRSTARRILAQRQMCSAALRDLGTTMCNRGQGTVGGWRPSIILADDPPEVWTASLAATACVVIASIATSQDSTDAMIRLRFVLDHAWRLPVQHRDVTLQRIASDMRAIVWGNYKALPYRPARKVRRRFIAERNASKRAGRSFLS